MRSIAAAALSITTLLAAAGCSDDDTTVAPAVTFATVAPSAPPTADTQPDSSGPEPTSPAPTEPTSPPTEPGPRPDPTATLTPLVSLASPVDLAVRPGDQRLYVALQAGTVVIVDPTQPSAAAVVALDITDLTEESGEQGLLGLAFHPTEPFAYVNYTDNRGDTVIDEFAVVDGALDRSSQRTIITITQPYGNHNGGEVLFGPDGMLYVGMGDGGAGGDPERYALNVGSLLGKVLRIDPRTPAGGLPYTVPADNPFVGVDGARPEIWSVGLRNPWRMSFDPATGDLWIADVGQGELEEINRVSPTADGTGAGRGINFGWSAFEGTERFNDDQPADGATPPVYQYPHGDAGCSVSGGEVYRGTQNADLVGWYVYADYCSGQVSALLIDNGSPRNVQLGSSTAISAVAAGPDGELFVLSLEQGVLAITA